MIDPQFFSKMQKTPPVNTRKIEKKIYGVDAELIMKIKTSQTNNKIHVY